MIRFISRRSLVALVVVLIAYVLFSMSYFKENDEVYLFPLIVTTGILLFSLISLVRETKGLCLDDYKPFPFLHLLPGIIMMCAIVMVIETIGMYSTSAIALLVLSAWYSPVEDLKKRLSMSLMLSIGFTLFIYLLFSIMLDVQTPRGWLI